MSESKISSCQDSKSTKKIEKPKQDPKISYFPKNSLILKLWEEKTISVEKNVKNNRTIGFEPIRIKSVPPTSVDNQWRGEDQENKGLEPRKATKICC